MLALSIRFTVLPTVWSPPFFIYFWVKFILWFVSGDEIQLENMIYRKYQQMSTLILQLLQINSKTKQNKLSLKKTLKDVTSISKTVPTVNT